MGKDGKFLGGEGGRMEEEEDSAVLAQMGMCVGVLFWLDRRVAPPS